MAIFRESRPVAQQQERDETGEQEQEASAARIARHPSWKSWHGPQLSETAGIPVLGQGMFDETYFTSILPQDVVAAGGHPIVEVQLISGHSHRIRSVLDTSSLRVTLETYLAKGDLAHERPRFGDTDSGTVPRETFRTVVAYQSIVAIVFDPSESPARVRPGFASN